MCRFTLNYNKPFVSHIFSESIIFESTPKIFRDWLNESESIPAQKDYPDFIFNRQVSTESQLVQTPTSLSFPAGIPLILYTIIMAAQDGMFI